MLDPSARSLSGLWHVACDVTIAALTGGLVILVFYPLTLCAAGVKGLLGIAGKGKEQRGEAQERAERELVR
jgi:hypothetical protein